MGQCLSTAARPSSEAPSKRGANVVALGFGGKGHIKEGKGSDSSSLKPGSAATSNSEEGADAEPSCQRDREQEGHHALGKGPQGAEAMPAAGGLVQGQKPQTVHHETPHAPAPHAQPAAEVKTVDKSNPLASYDRSGAGHSCNAGLAWPDSEIGKAGQPHNTLSGGPPRAPNEDMRALTYKAMQLQNMAPCSELDIVLATVCSIFDAPYASLALYSAGACWLANTVNFPQGPLPWPVTACPWNLHNPSPMTLACGDLLEDARFSEQPWVKSGLRCYVSAPLLASNGHRLGTICYMDSAPRKVDAGMCRVLNNCAEIAVRVLERHVGLAHRLRAARVALPPELERFLNAAAQGMDPKTAALPGAAEGYWESAALTQAAAEQVADSSGGAGGAMERLHAVGGIGAEARRALQAMMGAGMSNSSTSSLTGGSQAQEMPEEMLVMNAFWRQLRSHEHTLDACVLLVDTSRPGWPVIFADETWRLWAGYGRDEIVGKPLASVVMPSTPSVAPPRWDALSSDTAAGARFVLHGLCAVPAEQLKGVRDSAASGAGGEGLAVGAVRADGKVSQSAVAHDLDSPANSRGPQHAVPTLHSADAYTPVVVRSTSAASVHTSAGAAVPSAAANATEVLLEQMVAEEADIRDAQRSAVKEASAAAGIVFGHEATGSTASGSKILSNHPSATSGPLGSTAVRSGEHAGAGAAAQVVQQSPHTSATSTAVPTHLSLQGHMGLHGDGSGLPAKGVLGTGFDLSFRPTALDVLDGDSLPLGLPSHLPMQTSTRMLSLYTVRLHPPGPISLTPETLLPTAKVLKTSEAVPTMLAQRFFPDLELDQVLGMGGYGVAYHGHWHDADVVLKVQDHVLQNADELREAQLEVALGQIIGHPNLVRTLGHAAAEMPSKHPRAAPVSAASTRKAASGKRKGSKPRTGRKRSNAPAEQPAAVGVGVGAGAGGAPAVDAAQLQPVVAAGAIEGEAHDSFAQPPSDCSSSNNASNALHPKAYGMMRAIQAAAAAGQAADACAGPADLGAAEEGCEPALAPMGARAGGGAQGAKPMLAHRALTGVPEESASAAAMLESDLVSYEGVALDDLWTSKQAAPGAADADVDMRTEVTDVAFWFSNADEGLKRMGPLLSRLHTTNSLPFPDFFVNAVSIAPELPAIWSGGGDSDESSGEDGSSSGEESGEEGSEADAAADQVPAPSETAPSTAGAVAAAAPEQVVLKVGADKASMTGPATGESVFASALSSTITASPTGTQLSTFPATSSVSSSAIGLDTGVRNGLVGAHARANMTTEGVVHSDTNSDASTFSAFFKTNGSDGPALKYVPNLGRAAAPALGPSKLGMPQALAAAAQPGATSGGSEADSAAVTSLARSARSTSSVAAALDGISSAATKQLVRAGARPVRYPLHLRTLALMEFCDGGSLQDAVDRGWLRIGACSPACPPDIPKILRLAIDILSGLEHLHSCGVVHADLSANNVLLTKVRPQVKQLVQQGAAVPQGVASAGGPSASASVNESAGGSTAPASGWDATAQLRPAGGERGAVAGDPVGSGAGVRRFALAPLEPQAATDMHFVAKIADFGKARLLSPEGIMRVGGYATVTHMAPETLSEKLISREGDIYSVGVLLWQMYTGSRPWAGLSHSQIFAAITMGEASLQWPADTQPAGLAALGRACLAYQRTARPSTAEVLKQLRELLQAATTP